MRGCAVVLYVAVLLCFLSSAFGALDCGVNGVEVKTGSNVCICKSGFSGATCGTATDDACTVIHPEAETADNFPKLVAGAATVFRSNTLFAKISGPIVANRTYTELVFTGASGSATDKCSFGSPSSYWTVSTDCNGDVFSLALPWVSHTDCGFDQTAATDAQFLVVGAKLHLKYVDYVYLPLGNDSVTGETLNYMLDRTVSIPYTMTVKFQKTIEVKLLALNITSDVKFGAALTGDEYDPVGRVLTLTITTIINYPNSFRRMDSEFWTPLNVSLLQVAGPGAEIPANLASYGTEGLMGDNGVYSNNPFCDTSSATESPCTQTWTMKLTLNDGCSYDGAYVHKVHLFTCRGTNDGNDQDCTNVWSFVNFTISAQSTCGEIRVTPEVTGSLVPFLNKAGIDETNYATHKKDRFKLGEYGNFFALIASDGNDIYVNFTDVRFKVKGADDSTYVYLYQNKAHVVDAVHAQLALHHAQKYFTIYFHSSVFKVQPDTATTYTFSATVDILFEGNQGEQKRSVEYTFDSASMNTEANAAIVNGAIKTVAPAAAAETTESTVARSSVTFIASVVGAIAGTMIIVFVVVGFALRTRAQSEKRDVAASAAVVAANAAAQAIDVSVHRV